MARSKSSSMALVSGVIQKQKDIASTRKSCQICAMPVESRNIIEEMMARGVSNNAIILTADSFDDGDLKLTPSMIRRHVDHLPAKLYTYREIMERRARESGISLDDDSRTVSSPMAFLEMMVNTASDNMIKHPRSIDPKSGIQAAKVLMDAERDDQNHQDVVEWVMRFRGLIQAVKDVCSDDEINEILEKAGFENEGEQS